MFFSTVAASALALASSVAAMPSEYNPFSTRSNCKNTPTTRDCWGNGWDVYCDYDQQWPASGRVVKFDLHLTSGLGGVAGSKAPLDGHQRQVLLINGQTPGPKIEANWGDTVQITVHNDLDPAVWDNGTSFHWHGVRQYHTNTQDGTNGITECPIPPGQSRTYTWVATAYGTSWYHSHYSIQYADGVVGPIVIHGPASANYDIELAPILLTDWFYEEAFNLYEAAKVAPGPPTSDTVLVNGMMVSQGGAAGKYYSTILTPGKKHLVRFVNTGINDYFHVNLDGHQFQVIAADFVPVTPFYTSELVLGIGQRYDVIIEANNTVANYWMNIGTGNGGNARGCDGPNAAEGTVKAIFRYRGAGQGNPTSTGPAVTTGCNDLNHTLSAIVKTTVPKGNAKDFEVGFIPANTSVQGSFVTWTVNSSAMHIDWNTPTLDYVLNNTATNAYPKTDNVYELGVKANQWTYWVLHQDPNNPPLPHPIHLHGHDFWVVAQGSGAWDGTMQLKNPTRRDTATLPAAGHLVLAFPADNPGAWLMHCHIPFHISGGLGLQFLERKSEIKSLVSGLSGFQSACSAWDSYQTTANGKSLVPVAGDSGL